MLDEAIRAAFQRHIADSGLITAPEKLLAAVLTEVAVWLQKNEQALRKKNNFVEAKAFRHLRTNLRRSS